MFAILILSILGLLFKGNHHEMVGGIDDPENGPEVAATIFVAVLVYAVSRLVLMFESSCFRHPLTTLSPGLPCVLRPPGPAAPARKPARSDCVVGPAHATNGVEDPTHISMAGVGRVGRSLVAEFAAGTGTTEAGIGLGLGAIRGILNCENRRRHTSGDHSASNLTVLEREEE